MNTICCIIFEGPRLSFQAVTDAGLMMLFMNAAVAFCLNVAVVFLVHPPPTFLLTIDRENLLLGLDSLWCSQRYPSRRFVRHDLVHSSHSPPNVRLLNRPRRSHLLQTRRRTSPSSIHETRRRRKLYIQPFQTFLVGKSRYGRPRAFCRSCHGTWIFSGSRD